MRIDKDLIKEERNRKKHKVGFSLAGYIFNDPLAVIVYDRFENGEDRWHCFGTVGDTLFLVVHTYPDENDDQWVRVVGLGHATKHERKLYERGGQA